MQKAGLQERLRYQFDNFMSRGSVALIGGLAAVTAAMIAVAAAVILALGIVEAAGDPFTPGEALWAGLMHAMDPGTLGGDTGWALRAVMLAVTIGGIFILSALIGVINTGLEERLTELRRGRSRVIEEDHTVILGWSSQIFPVLSELAIANESRPGACVVILCEQDKVETEERIREKLGDGKLRVVCRSGSPMDMDDLEIVSLQTSRAIIVLAPEEPENPDAEVIKVLLAVLNHPQRRPEPYHIVAEILDSRNANVAEMIGGDEVEIVQIGTLISRITAQTCRQSGLSVVYTDLLDFDGDEIYLHEEPALVGKTYQDALYGYAKCAVLGIAPHGADPQLNPPMDTVLRPGDRLLLIAEDDSVIRYSPLPVPPVPEYPESVEPLPTPEHTLILGWNWRVPGILCELDCYVVPGSSTLVVAEAPDAARELEAQCGALENMTHSLLHGDTTDRDLLERLLEDSPQHIIVVPYQHLSSDAADALTLITLLHIRAIVAQRGLTCSIVSEMRDMRNRALAEVTQADDFIISDRLLSLMLAQVSETKQLNAVFADVFDADGSEIYLKPAVRYAATGREVSFLEVVAAAAARGETALGYRRSAEARDAKLSYGVHLNPPKTEKITFADGDTVIVAAED